MLQVSGNHNNMAIRQTLHGPRYLWKDRHTMSEFKKKHSQMDVGMH